MPQLSLYLDETSMTKLRADAAAAHLSLSSYARSRLSQPLRADGLGYPAGFFDLYGCWAGEEIEEPPDMPVVVGELDWSEV